MIDTTAMEVILISATAIIGIFGLASGLEGYCFTDMNKIIRVLTVIGGLLLIYPGIATDGIGFVLVIGSLSFQYLSSRTRKA
jgi:TRAP-type uncharacterized transport system fused permease subunit